MGNHLGQHHGVFPGGIRGFYTLAGRVSPLLQAGFLGGYTTYSTAIMDTIGYTFKPEFNWGYAWRATFIIAASMAVGIAAALAGAWLGCLS